MSKIAVIDLDLHKIRILEGELRGSRLRIQQLREFEVPEDDPQRRQAAVREHIAAGLGHLRGTGTRVLGLIGRSQAVLRDLRMPKVPDEELPNVVRFQAMRELSFPVEQAAIDYDLVGEPDATGQRQVLLAALQLEVIERGRGAVAHLGLQLDRLGLRPYATWMAYQHVSREPNEATLVVGLAGESVELTIGRGADVLFSRATRLRTEVESGRALAGEVRRTLAAFSNQFPNLQVQRVVIPAVGEKHEELGDAISETAHVPVVRIDPLLGVELAGNVDVSAADLGGFVAAIGAALGANSTWAIDFLNPKKPVVKPDRRKPMAIAAAAAIVFIIAAGYFAANRKISQGAARIQARAKENSQLDATLKEAETVFAQHDAVREWSSAEVDALGGLWKLTKEFPDTRKMYLRSVSLRIDPQGNRTAVLDGVAQEWEEYYLYAVKMKARPSGKVKKSRDGWPFQTAITLQSDEPEPAGEPQDASPEISQPAQPAKPTTTAVAPSPETNPRSN